MTRNQLRRLTAVIKQRHMNGYTLIWLAQTGYLAPDAHRRIDPKRLTPDDLVAALQEYVEDPEGLIEELENIADNGECCD